MRVLAIDPGSQRVGLALSDEDASLASPLETLEYKGDLRTAARIAEIVAKWEVGEIVLGLPLHMNGSEGPSALKSRALGQAISAQTSVPIRFVDERLSTVAATRSLQSAGMSAKRQRGVIDQQAAVVLLQGYLDARHNQT